MRVDNRTHTRDIMVCRFEKGWKGAQAFRDLNDLNELFDEGTISESRHSEWFVRVKPGDTSLEAVAEYEALTGPQLECGPFKDHSLSQKFGNALKLAGWMGPPRTQRQQ
uniref:HTH_48 domain-containing protein n=1 Tax=Glossina austeni TaxID=7395 RepID=A0A1A9UHX3_GLOAU